MDLITRVRIKNVRAIKYIDLEIARPITVLIGDNGSCKSTVIECLEILRKAAEPNFMQQFYTIHRGMLGLLRQGALALELGVVVEDTDGHQPRLEYAFTLTPQGAGAVVQSERLLEGPMNSKDKPRVVIRRVNGLTEILVQKTGMLEPMPLEATRPDRLVITSFGNQPPHRSIERLLTALGGTEVHLSFDTIAAWAARSYQFSRSMRGATYLEPTDRLSLLGFNLANTWASLKNMPSTHWEHTLNLVRLGMGDEIDNIDVTPDAGGGSVALSVRRIDFREPIPASNLSDGQLSWLAFIALTRINTDRSLLAIDEPELHLHPALLGRVMSLLLELDGGAPVVLSTHSDRVLELLEDPADAVRVCEIRGGEACILRVNESELGQWLKEFGDLGRLRASGYLSHILMASPHSAEGEGDDL